MSKVLIKIAEYLSLAGDLEKKVEVTRQVLNENQEFSARHSFRSLETQRGQGVTQANLQAFFEANFTTIDPKGLELLFRLYSTEEGYSSLSYEAFRRIVVTKESIDAKKGPSSPTSPTTNTLSREVKHSLIRVFEQQIDTIQQLEAKKQHTISKLGRKEHLLIFENLDLERKGILNAVDIRIYLSTFLEQTGRLKADYVVRRATLNRPGASGATIEDWLKLMSLAPLEDKKEEKSKEKVEKTVIKRYGGPKKDPQQTSWNPAVKEDKTASKARSGSRDVHTGTSSFRYLIKQVESVDDINCFTKNIPKDLGSKFEVHGPKQSPPASKTIQEYPTPPLETSESRLSSNAVKEVSAEVDTSTCKSLFDNINVATFESSKSKLASSKNFMHKESVEDSLKQQQHNQKPLRQLVNDSHNRSTEIKDTKPDLSQSITTGLQNLDQHMLDGTPSKVSFGCSEAAQFKKLNLLRMSKSPSVLKTSSSKKLISPMQENINPINLAQTFLQPKRKYQRGADSDSILEYSPPVICMPVLKTDESTSCKFSMKRDSDLDGSLKFFRYTQNELSGVGKTISKISVLKENESYDASFPLTKKSGNGSVRGEDSLGGDSDDAIERVCGMKFLEPPLTFHDEERTLEGMKNVLGDLSELNTMNSTLYKQQTSTPEKLRENASSANPNFQSINYQRLVHLNDYVSKKNSISSKSGIFCDLSKKEKKQLLCFIRLMMTQNKESERIRNHLSLRFDFTVDDFFRVMDSQNSGKVSKDDLQALLDELVVHKEDKEVESFFNLMDSDKDGYLDYDDICMIFFPFDFEDQQILAKRPPLGYSSLASFTQETQMRVGELLRHLIDSQEILGAIQQPIYIFLLDLFLKVDQDLKGVITLSDFKALFEEEQIHSSDLELCSFMRKFDPRGNGFVTFYDFLGVFCKRGNSEINLSDINNSFSQMNATLSKVSV